MYGNNKDNGLYKDYNRLAPAGLESMYVDLAQKRFSSPNQAQQMERDVERTEEGMRLKTLQDQINQSKGWGYQDYLAMAANIVPAFGQMVAGAHFTEKGNRTKELERQYNEELLSPQDKRDMLVGKYNQEGMTAEARLIQAQRQPKQSSFAEMAAFTDENSGAERGTKKWLDFYKDIKGKGGGVNVYTGDGAPEGPTSEVTSANKSAFQKRLMTDYNNINVMSDIESNYEEGFSTLIGRAGNWVDDKKAYVFGPDSLDDKEKETHGRYTRWQAGLKSMFNTYRKEITGAAAAEKELKDLEEAMVNSMDNPIAYQEKFQLYKQAVQQNIRMRNRLLREGFSLGSKDYLEEFNASWMMGASDTFEARRDELKGSGMDPQSIARRLKQEGYIGGGK